MNWQVRLIDDDGDVLRLYKFGAKLFANELEMNSIKTFDNVDDAIHESAELISSNVVWIIDIMMPVPSCFNERQVARCQDGHFAGVATLEFLQRQREVSQAQSKWLILTNVKKDMVAQQLNGLGVDRICEKSGYSPKKLWQLVDRLVT